MARASPVAPQRRARRRTRADAVGRSRSAGHLVDRHDYSIRTAGCAQGQGAADRRRKRLRRRRRFKTTQNQDRRDGAGTDADVALAYNDFWWDRGTKVVSTRQTSLVVDPPDGRVPALTAEGRARAAARAARGYNSWEDRSLWERCITRGLPMIPGPYNNNYQILQTPGYVVILHEMIHDARIIPISTDVRTSVRTSASGSATRAADGKATRSSSTRPISPTRRTSEDPPKGCISSSASPASTPDTVKYEFTIDDPTTFTKKWTVAIPMAQTDEQIYEYACHEGNYGMVNLLKGREGAGARGEVKCDEVRCGSC